MNPTDIRFKISGPALNALRDRAVAAGVTFPNMFRRRATALVAADKPRFNISGADLSKVLWVGLSAPLQANLSRIAGELGVPRDAVAELVACFEGEA